MSVHVHATYCHFYLFYVNGNAKQLLFLLLNGTQYLRPKMAVRSTQGQNRTVRSTQGGGVPPSDKLFDDVCVYSVWTRAILL